MNFRNFGLALFVAILIAYPASAQLNTLTGTTLSVAATRADNSITVTSATGLVAPSGGVAGTLIYVQSPGTKGEVMQVQSISSTVIKVARGIRGSQRQAHTSGALVLAGAANLFYDYDPSGACTTATINVTPWVNVQSGLQWLCSTITLSWVPGFGNTTRPVQPTAAVASAAGAIVPSGPLFHITGTAAITGFTLPLGFSGGSFCAIADAIWTWTAAGNIAVLGTTTAANRQHCFVYDSATSKWYPDKVI